MLEVLKVPKIVQDKGQTKYLCPFCASYRALEDPARATPLWKHPCDAKNGSQVYFLNEHALAGVPDYMATQCRGDEA